MVYIGSDHGGFDLKSELISYIKDELKVDVEDKGCFSKDSVDYPDYAKAVSAEVLKNNGIGVLICSTGVGISIAANKIKGIRCALCSEGYSAEMSRRHNNANVLALGGKVTGSWLAKDIVKAFLSNSFEGGRHGIRVDKIMNLEC